MENIEKEIAELEDKRSICKKYSKEYQVLCGKIGALKKKLNKDYNEQQSRAGKKGSESRWG